MRGTIPRTAESEEIEALELYAPDNARARLACPLVLSCDVRTRNIKSA